MEAFNSTVLVKTQFLSIFSASRRSPPPSNRFTKKPPWNDRNRFHFISPNRFSRFSSTFACRNLQIFVRLERAPKRRNSLRKKLLEEGKVRHNPDILNPSPNLNSSNYVSDQNEKPPINSSLVNLKGSDFSDVNGGAMENSSVEKLNHLDDSVLRTELENWADQYKKDTEYWGVGSGPIFTIYQGLHGNVIRVLVNNDEIFRRSGVEPSSFKSNQVGEEIANVNSKISFANLIAREIESGGYKLSKNSTIATFVVQNEKTSFVEGFHSATLQGNSLLKLSRIGFVLLCGCFIFWAAKKIFVGGNDEVELTKEEEEMLRRKIRSRTEKAKMETGSVEVVGNDLSLEPLGRPIQRPQLDKDELMKTISKAKAANQNSAILDSSDNYSANEGYFNAKILEIQEMARHVREFEQQNLSEFDEDGDENDVPVISQSIKEEMDTHLASADKNTNSVVKALKPASETEMKFLSSVDSGKFLHDNHPIEATSLEDALKEDAQCCSDLSASCDTESSISSTSKMEPLKSDLNFVQDPSKKEHSRILTSYANEDIQSHDLSNHKAAPTSKISVKMKPRIISSVEEARDYLSRKHDPLDGPHVHGLVNGKEANGNVDGPISEKIKAFKPSEFDKASDPKFSTGASKGFALANENLAILDSSDNFSAIKGDFNTKILEIQEMAGQARELEQQNNSEFDDRGGNDVPVTSQAVKEEANTHESSADKNTDFVVKALDPTAETEMNSSIESGKFLRNNHPIEATSLEVTLKEDTQRCSDLSASCEAENSISRSSKMEALKNDLIVVQDQSKKDFNNIPTSYANEETQSHDFSNHKSAPTGKLSVKMKQRMISSVEEAQDCLSRKCDPLYVPQVHSLANGIEANGNEDRAINEKIKASKPYKFEKASDSKFITDASEGSVLAKDLSDDTRLSLGPCMADSSDSLSPRSVMNAQSMPKGAIDEKPANAEKSWAEENFQEFEPIIKKIGVGFQENYKVAKEKAQEQSSVDISQLAFKVDDRELEWMKDDSLREIVFQVRENELAGRDPFHLMDAEDQNKFFKGLEEKVEKVNEELLGLHERVHSSIENLDYGSDGISIYDPPEKIIPRWKGPKLERDPEFLKSFMEHRKKFFEEELGSSNQTNWQQHDKIQKLEEPSSSSTTPSYGIHNPSKIQKDEASRDPKTVIEGSDGSIRAGKKLGKEHWQHTKKWTREFLEVYNAETDPEVKSIMKDMGKDLDRWITEKEIQEATDLMTRIPKRKRRYIEKKMDKLKREIEMFGQHAVVSKYREYSEEKEEDYLWWLDLPYVLCIEMYINEDGNQRVGLYSLEMAADLELDPKQYHVVGFEDPGDCKNFCYILQAHMEMLGSGFAFVVARPPKDAFREAKANGFIVTVIRKGQLQLNIDQKLEEVENEITEIGSKMYHDKIMRERSVDMSGLVKGIFSAGKTKRRSKSMLTMPTKR